MVPHGTPKFVSHHFPYQKLEVWLRYCSRYPIEKAVAPVGGDRGNDGLLGMEADLVHTARVSWEPRAMLSC
jgi:hypothetical protein